MRIVQLTTDAREHYKEYDKVQPFFGTAPQALLAGFARVPNVEVHVVSCIQQPMTSPEKLADNIWYHALLVPKAGWLRTGYQGCVRAVRRKLRDIRPDIVHGQGTERDCALNAVFSGFPNVLTLHGNMRVIAKLNRSHPFTFNWLAARLESFAIPRSDGVVCITRYTQDAVADLARRTWVLPNAVDPAFFDIEPRPSDKSVILCVGNVCPRKNQNAFIRALDPLSREYKFDVLFLGGAQRDDAYCVEFFGLQQSRPWVRYGGFADREKLKQHFQDATLLALPSLEDNCPMVVLEAMAAQVPVVAANVGGVPDLVEDAITGLLFDPLDAASMRAAVERLLSDASLRERLARAARTAAARRFHPEAIARRHVEIYREVLREIPGSAL